MYVPGCVAASCSMIDAVKVTLAEVYVFGVSDLELGRGDARCCSLDAAAGRYTRSK